jgi:P27 family predicted phage terminase small subunit
MHNDAPGPSKPVWSSLQDDKVASFGANSADCAFCTILTGQLVKKGRRPKPRAVHELEGTGNSTRLRQRGEETEAPGLLSELDPPNWLDEAQRRVWNAVLIDAPLNLLRRIDAQVLAVYCERVVTHYRAVLAQRTLDQGQQLPFLTKTPNGPVLSPYLKLIKDCGLDMLRAQREMGFTPSARVGLAVGADPPKDPTEGDSEWAKVARLRVIAGGRSQRSA